MSITLTDQQWDGVKDAGVWFRDAEQFAFNDTITVYGKESEFLAPANTPDPFVFAGYAGSGKSTCVGQMIEHLGLRPHEVMYTAPTGKAAKVLTRKLKESGWPSAATTVHKAIYMPRGAKADEIDERIAKIEAHIDFLNSNGERGQQSYDTSIAAMDSKTSLLEVANLKISLEDALDSEGPSFTLKGRASLPEELRLFVVDEASMVGTALAEDLMSFNIPILAVGDPGQLSPVNDDWGFDMYQPDVFLSEIHRQAADNPIIHVATMAREGRDIKVGNYGDTVRVIKSKNDDATYDMESDAMVLVGTNKKRWTITNRIRKACDWHTTGPMADEPLIACRNSRDIPTLVNGSLLTCASDHPDLVKGNAYFKLTVRDDDAGGVEHEIKCVQGIFEEHMARKKNAHYSDSSLHFRSVKRDEHVDWAYAITVHKSQGSEFPEVVLHDESGVFRADNQRWLYTGITRASEKLTLVV